MLCCSKRIQDLQGRVKFPTGGIVRERSIPVLNRCNSDTDSKVWMEEEDYGLSAP